MLLLIRSIFSLTICLWTVVSLPSDPAITWYARPHRQNNGVFQPSARSWTPSEPVRFNGQPLLASSRSWTPSSGPGLVFAATGPKTNVGQLGYQLQDKARASASAAAASAAASAPPPPRPTGKAVHFPPDPSVTDNSQQRQQQQSFSSEFRPSQVLSFGVTDLPVAQASNPAFVNEPVEEIPVKTPRFISNAELAQQHAIQSVLEAEPDIQAGTASDASDLVDAMEQLVERLNEMENKINVAETERAALRETLRTVVTEKLSLEEDKSKLEGSVAALSDRISILELQFSSLEELTRETIDPNVFAQGNFAKSNNGQKRGTTSHCPDNFFSLDELDARAPCYHISTTPNYRKNWQDASSDCRSLGAKLAEPQTSDQLQHLTDYLRDKRTDQLGGGYWTGGINPGLIWLWPGTGRPLSSIASGQWSDPAESQPSEAANGKCLRLTYDRVLQRYALQSSDCQRYLYFVCELMEVNGTLSLDTTPQEIQQPLPPSTTTPRPILQVIPLTTTTVRSQLPLLPLQTTTAPPIHRQKIPTSRAVFSQSFPTNSVDSSTQSPRFSTRSIKRPVTKSTKATTVAPPTPNYISVLGFTELSSNQTKDDALNLAILSGSF